MIHGALGQFALGETEGEANTISPSSIVSAEAFGVPSIWSDGYAVFPSAVDSAEAFGVPQLDENKLFPASIDSAEAFGVPSVVMVIAPSSIASAEAFGSPEVYELVTYLPVSRLR